MTEIHLLQLDCNQPNPVYFRCKMLPIRPAGFLKSTLFLALLSAVLIFACGTQEQPMDGPETEDPAALIWDVWEKIDLLYAGRDTLDSNALVNGAIGGMLDLTQAAPYPFLTEVGRLRGQVQPGVPEEMADLWRAMLLHRQRWPGVNSSDLAAAAVDGLIAGLDDPAAAFLDVDRLPVAREAISENLEGTYLGIGARVISEDDQILLFPFEDSPAESAGIEAGDALLEVQGIATAGRSMEEVLGDVTGPEGTKIELLLGRSGEDEPLEVQVFRDNIILQSVGRQLTPGGIGYIYVSRFRDNTGDQLYEALEDLRRFDMLALILDLRSNPGGSEEAAGDVVGQFLSPGSVFIYQEDRNGDRREHVIRQDLDRFDLGDMPMVVLVNEDTKAEAEAVAAVLQENQRAVVMGVETFGIGSTYDFIELEDGSAIYMPVWRWFTPSGRPLGDGGVRPDVWVAFEPEPDGFGRESQFNEAYEYLDARLPPFR